MEALYIHIANQLESIRFGKAASGKLFDLAELKTCSFWRAVFAEFLATTLFVFLGLLSAIKVTDTDFTATGTDWYIKISLTFGVAIMAMIQMVGHVSGGHINPAVSIAMAVSMNISIVRCVFYVIAQCCGAMTGGLIVDGVTSSYNEDRNSGFAVTGLSSEVNEIQGVFVELILTFVLVIVIYGTTDPFRPSFGSPAVVIGLTVGVCHMAGIQYTGCGINPARSLGSAVASGKWDYHWVYWVGPICGGVLASLVYKFLLNPYRGVTTMAEAIEMIKMDTSLLESTMNSTAANGDAKKRPSSGKTTVAPA